MKNKTLARIYDQDRLNLLERLAFKTTLPEKNIRVYPVPQRGGWRPRNSESDVLKNRAFIRFTVPYDVNGKGYLDPLGHLDEKAKQKLAEQIGLDSANDFNPRKIPQSENFWANREVQIDGNGGVYDMSDPNHYIDVCILLTNYENIAASWHARKDKATYTFAVVDVETEEQERTSDNSDRVRAYELFDSMKNSIDKLEAIIWLRYWEKHDYPKPPERPTHTWLFNEVFEMVDKDTKNFLSIVEDDNFQIRTHLYKGLKHGILQRKGMHVGFAKADTMLGTFGEAVEHLANENHQEDYVKLKDQIERAESNNETASTKK